MQVTERDKTRIIALYDSDVSYNDQQFGELLKKLASDGHADDTMVVVTADHGEELWDHGKHRSRTVAPRGAGARADARSHYPPLFPAGQDGERRRGDRSISCRRMADALGGKMPATRKASR